jgi:hypothetical protein
VFPAPIIRAIRSVSTKLHGTTTQKTVMFILVAVIT